MNPLRFIIDFIHILISLSLFIGGYVIPIKYIPVYLLLAPFIIIDWNDTDGLCHLTKLSNMIKYNSLTPKTTENEDNFINNLLRKVNIIIDNSQLSKILYILIICSWLGGYLRIIRANNIKLFPTNVPKVLLYLFSITWLFVSFANFL